LDLLAAVVQIGGIAARSRRAFWPSPAPYDYDPAGSGNPSSAQ
jgi:hypothetical protein